jgi:hypothetical protein
VPTRLLRIDNSIKNEFILRLIDTCEIPKLFVARYTALSYCWGGEQSCKTTKALLAERKEKIDYGSLSQSIKDAIRVSSTLSIPYLWVDSLCIVQDDNDEKTREITKMPDIYRHAHVTISASRSARAEVGFLHDRCLTDRPEQVFRLPFRCPDKDGTLGSVILLPVTEDEDEDPLDQRAWALQERFFSRRILEFGKRQTRWICQQSLGQTDGWSMRKRSDQRAGFPDRALDFLDMVHRRKYVATPLAANIVLQQWQGLVEGYSGLEMSLPNDRLPALSGISQLYGSIFQSEYRAGLWMFAMPLELLWCVPSKPFLPISFTDVRLRRLKSNKAPSWSWASLNTHVRPAYPITHYGEEDNRLKIHTCEVELKKGIAPFGAVKSGKLRVTGHIRKAEWLYETLDDGEDKKSFLRSRGVKGPGGMLSALDMFPDAPESDYPSLVNSKKRHYQKKRLAQKKHLSDDYAEAEDQDDMKWVRITLLQVIIQRDGPGGPVIGPCGLALRKRYGSLSDENGKAEIVHIRIGYFCTNRRRSAERDKNGTETFNNWFDGSEQEMLVIV